MKKSLLNVNLLNSKDKTDTSFDFTKTSELLSIDDPKTSKFSIDLTSRVKG